MRSYANFLGLDGEHLASALDADKTGASDVRPLTPPPVGQTDRDAAPEVECQADRRRAAAASRPSPFRSNRLWRSCRASPASRASVLAEIAHSGVEFRQARFVSVSGFERRHSDLGDDCRRGRAVCAGRFLIDLGVDAQRVNRPRRISSKNVPNAIGGRCLPDRVAAAPVSDGPISITVIPGEHVWARITLDGQTAFEGMLDPSMARDWHRARRDHRRDGQCRGVDRAAGRTRQRAGRARRDRGAGLGTQRRGGCAARRAERDAAQRTAQRL